MKLLKILSVTLLSILMLNSVYAQTDLFGDLINPLLNFEDSDDFLYVIEVSSEIDHFGWLTGGQPFTEGTAIVNGIPNIMHDLGFKVYAYDLLAAKTPEGGGFPYKIFSKQPLGQEFRTFYTEFSSVSLYFESRGEYGAEGDIVTVRIRKNSVNGEILKEKTQFVEASIEPFWVTFDFDEEEAETDLKKYVIELVGENDHFAWKLGETYEDGQAIVKNHLQNIDFAFKVYIRDELIIDVPNVKSKGHLIFSNSQIAQEFKSEKEGFSKIEIFLRSENNFNLKGENLTLKLHDYSLDGKILTEKTIFVEKTLEEQWIEFILESVCGNGILEEGEQCDMGNFNNETCNSLGYDTGTLKCSNTCKFDTSTCEEIETEPIPILEDTSEKSEMEELWTLFDLVIRTLISLFVVFVVIVIVHQDRQSKKK